VVERYRPLLGPGLVEKPEGAIGQLAPQPRGSEGARLDDVSGYRFTVVGDADQIGSVDDATRDLWQKLDVFVVKNGGPVVRDWLAANGATTAVVRPDRYAYALAKDAKSLTAATQALAKRVLQ